MPSGSGRRFTAPSISASNAGQPQPELNLAIDVYSGVLHRRHWYVPSLKSLSYSPLYGGSVPLLTITCFSNGVSSFIAPSPPADREFHGGFGEQLQRVDQVGADAVVAEQQRDLRAAQHDAV